MHVFCQSRSMYVLGVLTGLPGSPARTLRQDAPGIHSTNSIYIYIYLFKVFHLVSPSQDLAERVLNGIGSC